MSIYIHLYPIMKHKKLSKNKRLAENEKLKGKYLRNKFKKEVLELKDFVLIKILIIIDIFY
jgi:hypothetical protein